MDSLHYSSADCDHIMDALISSNQMSFNNLTAIDISFLQELCIKVDDIKAVENYSKPLVLIGIYIAVASLICIIAMAADLLDGFRNRKTWFPCKYFSLNAASITVIAVAMKLPVDLSSPMPGSLDQATKLGSMAFMCTMMANLMPSLASMGNKSLFANFIGLAIFVITMIVNICIEINTGVIDHKDKRYHFTNVACIYVAMMILLLILLTSSAIAIPSFKRILESKYEYVSITAFNDKNQQISTTYEKLRQHLRRHWVMVETSSPQFVMANNPLSFASSIICVITIVVNLSMFWDVLRHDDYGDFYSDYELSMFAIYVTQFIGVTVGSISPIFRCYTVLNFKLITYSNRNHLMDLKVENYWIEKLCEWKENQTPLLSIGTRSRTFAHKLKNVLLDICIGFQMIIIVSCKIIQLIPLVVLMYCSSYWNSFKEMLYNTPVTSKNVDKNAGLETYVLQLEDDMTLTYKTLEVISKSMDEMIKKADQKEEHNNLLKLLKNSTGFDGVANFDMDQVDQPLLPIKFPNNWSLPIVTLTCIAISLPNTPKGEVNKLFKSVGEGLVYTRIVEESLVNSDSRHASIHRAATALWHEVEHNHKWLDNTLERSTYNGKTSLDMVKMFVSKAKETVTEMMRTPFSELGEDFTNKLIAADSMYCISQTLLFNYENNVGSNGEDDDLFFLLYGMISDIMIACFTNLPQVVKKKCRKTMIEKQEASVEVAAKLLGRTTGIIKILEAHELPSMDLDKLRFIDEWRMYLKQSIV